MDNQINTEPPQQPPPNIPSLNQNPVQPRSKLFNIVLGVSAAILILSLAAYYFISTSATLQTTNNISPTSSVITPTLTPTIILPPVSRVYIPVEEGFKQYRNENLAYAFNYPENLTIDECADISCLSLKEASINVSGLDSIYLSESDPKGTLLASDLYCSASGVTGSVECKNEKVEDFMNKVGLDGYKIYRTKTRTGDNPGVYEDFAYVFPLIRPVKGNGLIEYVAVLFSVDNVSDENLATLDKIVESFFYLP